MDYQEICPGCMRQRKEKDRPCPYCGFEEKRYRADSDTLPLRTVLTGKYLTGRVIGRGGFGTAYLAYDLALAHPVAIKEYSYRGRREQEQKKAAGSRQSRREKQLLEINRTRFEQEARILAACSGLPGIVQIYDYFLENDTAYIVMEYLQGMTLKEYVQSCGPIGFGEMASMLLPVMDSLQVLHQRGILHADLSPDNMKVVDQGSHKGQLILYDFGGIFLQRALQEKLGAAQTDGREKKVYFRKAGYTAPEQGPESQDRPGPWSDVYSMAATMYFGITGAAPAEPGAESKKRLRKRLLHQRMTLRQSRVLQKALSEKPEERYADMAEFSQAIRRAGTQSARALRRHRRRSTAEAVLLSLGFAAALLGSTLLLLFEIQKKNEGASRAYEAEEVYPGMILSLGRCEQDGEAGNGEEALEWIVLAVRDQGEEASALLLSRCCLFTKEFDNLESGREEDTLLSWRSSTLRRILTDTQEDAALWPQEEFAAENALENQYFTEEEKQMILPVKLEDGSLNRLFLLSREECEAYLPDMEERRAALTVSAYRELQQRGRIREEAVSETVAEDTPPDWYWLTRTLTDPEETDIEDSKAPESQDPEGAAECKTGGDIEEAVSGAIGGKTDRAAAGESGRDTEGKNNEASGENGGDTEGKNNEAAGENSFCVQVTPEGAFGETSVRNGDNGIRPAMWIRLKGSGEEQE